MSAQIAVEKPPRKNLKAKDVLKKTCLVLEWKFVARVEDKTLLTLPKETIAMYKAAWSANPSRKIEDFGYDYEWECEYYLNVALEEMDCRRGDVCGDKSKLKHSVKVPIHKTKSTGTATTQRWPNGDIMTPFRDCAHAQWDGEKLGKPPIYVILNGVAQELEYVPEEK